MATQLIVNGKSYSATDDPQTPLLWVLRDSFGLTGTKFGCGIAQCGACTVIVEGEAVRACVTPLARVAGKRITRSRVSRVITAILYRKPGRPSRSRNAATVSQVK